MGAYWLVLAAEEVALLMGHTELFSACDLNQCGQAFPGAKVALEAHRRWGFEDRRCLTPIRKSGGTDVWKATLRVAMYITWSR
eukprot:g18070.t1